MHIKEMTLEKLQDYKAVVEAYGTSKELYEVVNRIRELREQDDCSFSDGGKEK